MHGYCILEDSEHGLRLLFHGQSWTSGCQIGTMHISIQPDFSIFKLHTDFINFWDIPQYFLDKHEALQDWAGAEGEGAKRACLPHHNRCCGCCCPTWLVATHKPQPPHQWAGQKIEFYSLCRGNDEQSIAQHCLDGAVVWCYCFLWSH